MIAVEACHVMEHFQSLCHLSTISSHKNRVPAGQIYAISSGEYHWNLAELYYLDCSEYKLGNYSFSVVAFQNF